jgi:hypothetical protein
MFKFLMLSIVCSVNFISVFAGTYYVNSTNGHDYNNGTSPTTAWETISQVNSKIADNTIVSGDSVLFRTDREWNEEMLEVDVVASSGSRLTIGAYNPTYPNTIDDSNKPIIDVRGMIDQDYNDWILYSGNVYVMSLASDPYRLWIDSTEGFEAQDTGNISTTIAEMTSFYNFFYDAVNDNLYVYSTSNLSSSGVSISLKGLTIESCIKLNGAKYVIVENIICRGGNFSAIQLECSSYNEVKDCIVNYSKGGIYVIGNPTDWVESNYNKIYSNIVDGGGDFPNYKYECYNFGDGIRLLDGASYNNVYQNNVSNWGHAGISAGCYSYEDYTNNCSYNKIYENDITSPDMAYMRGLAVGGFTGKCVENKVMRNYIYNTTIRSQIDGQGTMFYCNVIDGVRNDRAPDTKKMISQGILISGLGGTDFDATDIIIANNTILNCEEAGLTIAGSTTYSSKTCNGNVGNKSDLIIANNLIYNCGSDSALGLDDVGLAIMDSETIYNNNYYNNNVYNDYSGSTVYVYFYKDTSYYAGTFKSNCDGDNGNVAGTHYRHDPDLDTDWLPGASQTNCIDVGWQLIDNYITFFKDFDGDTIDSGTVFDVGAQDQGL